MEPDDADKDRGKGSKRSSEESFQSPAKAAKVDDEIKKELTTPKAKQLTLAASLQKIGSPCEIKKISSPGAKRYPSLFEILSGEKTEKEAQPKDCVVVGMEGEEYQDPSKIKNGSRDR